MAQLKGHKLDSKWYNTVTLFSFKLTGSYIRQNLWQNSPHINITLQNIISVPCCLDIRSMGALKGRKRLQHKTDTKRADQHYSTHHWSPDELHAFWGARQNQPQSDIDHAGGQVGERDPEELGIPAGAVPGPGVSGRQGVLHAVGHLAEVGVAHCIHDQTLHLDVCKSGVYFKN